MKESYESELTPEVKEKLKKNLVYIGIISIVMLFGGLTSGYIVSMSDNFWLKFPFPQPFITSTILIGISSITFILAIRFAKQNKMTMLKVSMAITMLLGIGFVYNQFKGYGELVDNGIYFSSNRIMVNEGRYGDYFSLKVKGNHLIVDGNDYFLEGKEVTPAQKEKISKFAAQFIEADALHGLKKVTNYGNDFVLLYKDEPLTLLNENLMMPDGEILKNHDLYRLKYFAYHLKDGRGDFYIRGKFGKDFQVYFKNEELSYKDRSLYKGNQKLNAYLQNSAMDAPDTASSYLYILTFLHLLHIIVTILFMIKTVTYSFSGKYNSEDNLGLRVTGIFWHFLGLLWLFLLLFLLFIH